MTDRGTRKSAGRVGRGSGWIALALLAAGLPLAAVAGAQPAEEIPEAVSYCLACHSDESLTLALEDGSEMSLYVDEGAYLSSVHGEELFCTDCHEGYDDEHPMGATFASRRDYEIASYETCKKCHFDTYTRTLESVHYEYLKAGLDIVPVCTDCHGTHDIHNPHAKQAMMSRSCAECHPDVYEQYEGSVHGRALAEDIPDVPACADCHTAHSIADPGSVVFHLSSPELCIRCHGDEETMAPYDIPTEVATTYLADFHGVTASLADTAELEERKLVVTCVDCHGVHDIASPSLLPEGVMKAQVREVCNQCHEGAAADFPAAWLSHFRPSLQHAPLVFLVDVFYKIFIPFVVLGLILQVLLHLYRLAISRGGAVIEEDRRRPTDPRPEEYCP